MFMTPGSRHERHERLHPPPGIPRSGASRPGIRVERPGGGRYRRRVIELDLKGVPCPLNWARAKVRLEELDRGQAITVMVDDARSVRDLPRAAEAEGYAVLEVAPLSGAWRIVIEK
jgi:tRNA 2-thiouridine synthesizing protein A